MMPLANEKKAWNDDDDRLLVDLARRHVPTETIGTLLGRTKRAVTDRLHRHHPEAWAASGHPEANAKPRVKEQPSSDLERLEAKIDYLTVQISSLTRMVERMRQHQGEQLSISGDSECA